MAFTICCGDPNCPHRLDRVGLLEHLERQRIWATEELDRLLACPQSRSCVLWAMYGSAERPPDIVPVGLRHPTLYYHIKYLLLLKKRKPKQQG